MADTIKTFSGKVVLTQAQFSEMETAGTLQEGVEYEISDALDNVAGVTINGTSIVDATTHVANIPMAGAATCGAVKIGSWGAGHDSSGLFTSPLTYSQYTSATQYNFIGKGTLENVLDNQTVRVDKATSLTDIQKTQGRTNIGAIALEEYDSTATPVDGVLYYTTED